MIKQRRITQVVGKDTHVRNQFDNIFRSQGHSTYQMVVGEISKTQPEPLYQQNLVTVKLARGGEITNVAYPGAFIDPISGNIHGLYEGPIKNQMVAVGFENGNINNPFVVQRYPYQGVGNTAYEKMYVTPLQKAKYHPEDVILGHRSGTFLSLNTGLVPSTKLPGSAYFKTISDFELESSTNIKLDSRIKTELTSITIELSASTEVKITGNQKVTIKGVASAIIETDSGSKFELKSSGFIDITDSVGNYIRSSATQWDINGKFTVDK